LIAAWYSELGNWIALVEVIIGLGFIIFVHELGHFLVAKLCGVKCEKFYLGFDIGGLKLWKYRRGETEYGIGILPLGGYVKMLGQEDNPARLRAEIERARQQPGAAAADSVGDRQSQTPLSQRERGEYATAAEVDAARQALFDPRSYLAKSVPQRMAIISAGVVMNLIFAFVLAVFAFLLGVRQLTCDIGSVLPGEGAWRADLRVGDKVLEVAGRPVATFEDMTEAITLGDIEHGIPLLVHRPGVKDPVHIEVKAAEAAGRPRIGVGSSSSTTLYHVGIAAWPGTPAAAADPPFQLGDKIVKLDNRPVEGYAQIHSYLGAHAGQPLVVTIERKPPKKGLRAGDAQVKQLSIRMAPNPMRWLGLVMEMGPISAVQADSPAAATGIEPGDVIRTIDGQPVADPMTLPQLLAGRQGRTVKLGIQRGEQTVKEISLTLRQADGLDRSADDDSPVTINSLGLAYRVGNRVRSVAAGSPAADAGLRSGDVLVKATVLPPDDETLKQLRETTKADDLGQAKVEITFDETHRNWPFLTHLFQVNAPGLLPGTLPGTTVVLQWRRGENGEKIETTRPLKPVAAAGWFNPDRGLLLEANTFVQTAKSFREAVRLGADKTLDYALLVYRSIHKVSSGQVSARYFGGPISIFWWAIIAAREGPGNFLLFLTLISANLAVINFLPIPLLDGGHIVLLAWEGIRGKPADERVQLVLTYCGLLLILALMVWVLGLDLHLIARPGR
jgi:regulator of sigma E protease